MQIDIVTIYNGANCGAYLQAYALKKYLEKTGNSVYHLRVNKEKKNRVYFYRYINKRWVKSISFAIDYLKFGKIKYSIFNKAWEEFTVVEANKKCDLCVLGSDEIWNTGNSAFSNPIFYGKGLNSKSVISYAASIGGFKGGNVPDYVKTSIARLDAVMVRDEATKKYAERFTDKEVSIVCDPTLLYDFENQILPECNDEYIKNNKYILIYAYRYSNTEMQWIRQYAQKHSLKIVSASFYVPWCDYCVNCSPLELSDVIKKAELVYTSSFHCSIFSIYNKKQVVVRNSGQKVRDLLYRINAQSLLIENDASFEEFEGVAQTTQDYSTIMDSVLDFRAKSSKLLSEAIHNRS